MRAHSQLLQAANGPLSHFPSVASDCCLPSDRSCRHRNVAQKILGQAAAARTQNLAFCRSSFRQAGRFLYEELLSQSGPSCHGLHPLPLTPISQPRRAAVASSLKDEANVVDQGGAAGAASTPQKNTFALLNNEFGEGDAAKLIREAEESLGLRGNQGRQRGSSTTGQDRGSTRGQEDGSSSSSSSSGAWGEDGSNSWGERLGFVDSDGSGEEEGSQLAAAVEKEMSRADVNAALIGALSADSAIDALVEMGGGEVAVWGKGKELSKSDVRWLIEASVAAGNVALALSIRDACRTQGTVSRWLWPAFSISLAAQLLISCAAFLKVRDALDALLDVRQRGLPVSDEVSFGKCINCPTCRRPLAVVQPQDGVQICGCSRCRYEYELFSGEMVSCESKAASEPASLLSRALRFLRLKRTPPPAAVHAAVVKCPDGTARLHTFATPSSDVPAQEGERLTIASAAPRQKKTNNATQTRSRAFAAHPPGWQPGDPMLLANHSTGAELPLLLAPKEQSGIFSSQYLLPLALVAASSDAATALIDPSLPATVAIAAVGVTAAGGTVNAFLLPKLKQLPEREIAPIVARQKLLEQHDMLNGKLEALFQAAAHEVRMLARMCALQYKMEAVGERDAYSARMERVLEARQGLELRLASRLKLVDSYAKVLSMVEIEVEMDNDVIAAESAGASASIAEQIEKLMEAEDLQREWQYRAEANDEVEKLLRSAPALSEG